MEAEDYDCGQNVEGGSWTADMSCVCCSIYSVLPGQRLREKRVCRESVYVCTHHLVSKHVHWRM